jgi:hypothetical protein
MRRIAAVALFLMIVGLAPAEAAPQGERIVANAFAMGGVSRTSRIEFHIEEWSTDEQRMHCLNILAESGQAALVPELQKVEVGRPRVGTRNSYPISHAYQSATDDGGRRVVLVTIGGASTMEYSVSIVELRFPADGNGEGALIVRARSSRTPPRTRCRSRTTARHRYGCATCASNSALG